MKQGDNKKMVGVICPTNPLSVINEKIIERATALFNANDYEVCLKPSASEHLWKDLVRDPYEAVLDFHEILLNNKINLVLTGLGGYTTNWFVQNINYDLAQDSLKPICGYSDATSLLLAIHQRTSRITFYGPHFASFGINIREDLVKWSFNCMRAMVSPDTLMQPIIGSSMPTHWIPNEDWTTDNPEVLQCSEVNNLVLNTGDVHGVLLAGHLGSLLLSLVSGYCSIPKDCILAIETDLYCRPKQFIREFIALLASPLGKSIRGILLGRLQPSSGVTVGFIRDFFLQLKELTNIPIVIEVPFGHTFPALTLPIGANAMFSCDREEGFSLSFQNQS